MKHKLPKILKKLSFENPDFDLFIGMNCSFKEYAKSFDLLLSKMGEQKLENAFPNMLEDDKDSMGKELFFFDKKSGAYRCGLYLREFDWNIQLRAVMNHEIRHLVDDISDYLGFMKEREFTAYMTENISKKIETTFLVEWKKLNKKK